MPVALKLEYAVGNAQGERGMQSLSAALERAGDNVRHFGRFVFPRLIPVFEKLLGAQFDAEGRGPFAGHWAPLSADYRARKERSYPGRRILERTGALRAALTSSSSPFASRDYSDAELAFGTAGLEYASFHQVGTSRMPARPPFDFPPDAERELRKAVQLGVIEAIREADHEDMLGTPSGEP